VELNIVQRFHRLPREARDTLFLLGVIAWTVMPHLSHLPLWCIALTTVMLAWRTQLAFTNAPLPRAMVAGGDAHPRGRSHDLDLPDAAGQRARRDHGRRADGTQDAGIASAPRCIRGVLPRLLHHPHALPVLAVAAGGGGDARVGVGGC